MRTALLVVVVVVTACGTRGTRMTTVPIGLTLEGETSAATVRVSLAEAVARRDELRADEPPPGMQRGERTWLFRAFDDRQLVFLEASYAPYDDGRVVKRAGRYHIERRVIVPRSADALDALGIRGDVEQRESGICGIRVGMTTLEVQDRLGPPTDVTHPQAAGCVDETYGALEIRSCHGSVTAVRGRCDD